MEVKVKPLVWREANDGNYRKGECFTTRSPISFAPIAAHKKHDGWWLNVDCKTYPTLEAAKAAAQADYEARIRSAIVQPTLSDALEMPEIKAMRDALELARRIKRMPFNTAMAIENALCALPEKE